VSVRLTLEFGPTAVTRTAYRLGIASKLEPNASVSLGTSEVTPLELVSAYVPFANGGISIMPHVIERVKTAEGKVLYKRKNESLGRIVEPAYVAMMNRMMRETVTVGTARKAELPGWSAAGKTGTSQDFRDAWFVGYTGQFVAGVWVGNDDGRAMNKVMGGSLPARLWHDVMLVAHEGRAPSAAMLAARNGQPADQRLQPLMPRERIGSDFVDRAVGEDGRKQGDPGAQETRHQDGSERG
jgi:penicillin-binding protein 1A